MALSLVPRPLPNTALCDPGQEERPGESLSCADEIRDSD